MNLLTTRPYWIDGLLTIWHCVVELAATYTRHDSLVRKVFLSKSF